LVTKSQTPSGVIAEVAGKRPTFVRATRLSLAVVIFQIEP
jgi:hypothetical protein